MAEETPAGDDTKFEIWWRSDGRSIDPDTSDVDWYDKRKELAAEAYRAGLKSARENDMAEETPKSPENPDNPSPPKYRSKCLVCGMGLAWHLRRGLVRQIHAEGGTAEADHPEDLDAHRYPFEHVTLEDVEMWRKSGDSEQAIMSRIAGRGMAE
jgi:hypothetical protein